MSACEVPISVCYRRKGGSLESQVKFSEVNLSFSTVSNKVKILNHSCRIICSCALKLVLVGASVVLGVEKLIYCC